MTGEWDWEAIATLPGYGRDRDRTHLKGGRAEIWGGGLPHAGYGLGRNSPGAGSEFWAVYSVLVVNEIIYKYRHDKYNCSQLNYTKLQCYLDSKA